MEHEYKKLLNQIESLKNENAALKAAKQSMFELIKMHRKILLDRKNSMEEIKAEIATLKNTQSLKIKDLSDRLTTSLKILIDYDKLMKERWINNHE